MWRLLAVIERRFTIDSLIINQKPVGWNVPAPGLKTKCLLFSQPPVNPTARV